MISRPTETCPAHVESNKPSKLDLLLAEIGIKRITDQILLHWGTEQGDVYMNSLLINDRENYRIGFPPHVSKAIFTLIKLNESELRGQREKSPAEPH